MLFKAPLLICTAAVALVCSAASLAAVKTTGPGSRLDVYVSIFDTTAKTRYGQAYEIVLLTQSDYKGGSESFFTEWSEVSRGEVARFNITNKGKKPHKFKVFGKTTKALRPGAKAVFLVPLLKRGSFPYTIDTGTKGFKGVFLVN